MIDRLRGVVTPARVVMAGVGVAALVDALAIEPYVLKIREERVGVKAGSEALLGARIAHLSDLHVMGRGWKSSTVRASLEAVNESSVDLVLITGDFLGGGRGADVIMKVLSALRKDVPCLAVYGNHDHVYGVQRLDALARALSGLGIKSLCNEVEPVDLPSGRVWVGGVDDAYSQRDDLDRVMRRFEEVVGPRILLTHYPDLVERLKPCQVDLSLAGHSHGGQIRIPVLGTLMHRAHARTNYGKGLFIVNGNPLYVSAGVGMSGVPMRFLNPPEVPIITFVEERPFTRVAHSGASSYTRSLATRSVCGSRVRETAG